MGHPSPLPEYTQGVLRYCCNVDQPACVTLNELSLESEIQDRDEVINRIALTYSPQAGERHQLLYNIKH